MCGLTHLLAQQLDLLVACIHLHLPGSQRHKAAPFPPAALHQPMPQPNGCTLQQGRPRLVPTALTAPSMQAAAQLPQVDAPPGGQRGGTPLLLARMQVAPCLQALQGCSAGAGIDVV